MDNWAGDGCLTRESERPDESFLSQVRRPGEKAAGTTPRDLESAYVFVRFIHHKINNKQSDLILPCNCPRCTEQQSPNLQRHSGTGQASLIFPIHNKPANTGDR